LINLGDTWIHFDLREDLVKNVKVGDRYIVRIPALGDRRITVEVELIMSQARPPVHLSVRNGAFLVSRSRLRGGTVGARFGDVGARRCGRIRCPRACRC
jgi:hypothetical protein